jgi:hypothetical protein
MFNARPTTSSAARKAAWWPPAGCRAQECQRRDSQHVSLRQSLERVQAGDAFRRRCVDLVVGERVGPGAVDFRHQPMEVFRFRIRISLSERGGAEDPGQDVECFRIVAEVLEKRDFAPGRPNTGDRPTSAASGSGVRVSVQQQVRQGAESLPVRGSSAIVVRFRSAPAGSRNPSDRRYCCASSSARSGERNRSDGETVTTLDSRGCSGTARSQP